jgi:hypothetical protein
VENREDSEMEQQAVRERRESWKKQERGQSSGMKKPYRSTLNGIEINSKSITHHLTVVWLHDYETRKDNVAARFFVSVFSILTQNVVILFRTVVSHRGPNFFPEMWHRCQTRHHHDAVRNHRHLRSL